MHIETCVFNVRRVQGQRIWLRPLLDAPDWPTDYLPSRADLLADVNRLHLRCRSAMKGSEGHSLVIVQPEAGPLLSTHKGTRVVWPSIRNDIDDDAG